MATYVSKSGGHNFTSTWSEVDSTSFNGQGYSHYSTALSTTYQNSASFTPGAITIDGFGIYVQYTNYRATHYAKNFNSCNLDVAIAQGGTTVAGTNFTVDVTKLYKPSSQSSAFLLDNNQYIYYRPFGAWIFFKFASPITLAAATAYTIKAKATQTTDTVIYLGNSDGGTNFLRFLRKTTTATPAASDRLIICGEMDLSGNFTECVVTHDLTSSATTYGELEVGYHGTWNFPSASGTGYYFKTNSDVHIGQFGKMTIASSASNLPESSSATFEFDPPSNVSNWQVGSVFSIHEGAEVSMYGATKTSYAYLTADIAAGATSANVTATQGSAVDPNWKNGDQIVMSPATTSADPSGRWNTWDIKNITADSSSGNLSFSATTNYHRTDSPWVANTTRNIKFFGSSAGKFVFATQADDLYLKSVEIYNYNRTVFKSAGDRKSTMINCSVGRGNTNVFGAWFPNTYNFDVIDCVFTQSAGVIWDGATINAVTEANFIPPLMKDCILIAKLWDVGDAFIQNYWTNNGSNELVVIDNCIVTGSNYPIRYRRFQAVTGSFVAVKNCTFDVNYQPAIFTGFAGGGDADTRHIDNDFRLIIENCSFLYAVFLEQQAIDLNNCTITKRYSSNTNFIYAGYYGYLQYWRDFIQTNVPIRINNCNLVHLGASKQSAPINNVGCHVEVNGGTIDCAWGIGNWIERGKTVYNNVSQPNITLNTTSFSDGNPYMSNYPCTLRFQNFNQVVNDHRTYEVHNISFTDNSDYDSSPRSLKIMKRGVPAGYLKPLQVPAKAGQSPILSIKIKPKQNAPDTPGSDIPYQGPGPSGYTGLVPYLKIKAQPHLGANYNNDQFIKADPSLFNGSTSFVPTNLSSNLRLWVSSKNLSDITRNSRGRVSQWNDLSGLNNHLAQSNEDFKPIYKDYIKGTLESGVYLPQQFGCSLKTSSDIMGGTAQDWEVFYVTRPTGMWKDIAGFGNFAQAFSFNNSTDYYGIIYESKGWYLCKNGSTKAAAVTSRTVGSSHLPQIWRFRHNYTSANQIKFYLNNTEHNNHWNGFYPASFPEAFAATSFGIGASQPVLNSGKLLSHGPAIEFYEVIVVNRLLTDQEANDMFVYLANKFNILNFNNSATSFVSTPYSLPAVANDGVIEAELQINGFSYINIDSISVS